MPKTPGQINKQCSLVASQNFQCVVIKPHRPVRLDIRYNHHSYSMNRQIHERITRREGKMRGSGEGGGGEGKQSNLVISTSKQG